MTDTTAPAMMTVKEVEESRPPYARYAVQTGRKLEYFETLEFAYHRADEYSAGLFAATPVVVFHLSAPPEVGMLWEGKICA